MAPISRDAVDKTPTPIGLDESIEKDCEFIYRPAMLAAYVLDPLNWALRGKQYMTPLDNLRDEQVEELETWLAAFSGGDDTASGELTALLVNGIPAKYTKAVQMLVTPDEDGRVSPAASRISLWSNLLCKVYPTVAVVAATVLAMPVTSCAAERNWTIWGQVYIKTRSN